MRISALFLLLNVYLEVLAYQPVITPNGSTLPFTLEEGWKVFRLVAEPIKGEFAPGFNVNLWGYNGQSPGPTIEAVEGDKVRILVTNHLVEPTTVHWHGILLPNGMDGVTGVTQKPILPGQTFKYEFILRQSGTYMYHPHFDDLTQIGLGMMGFFIIHPKEETAPVSRDFAIMLMEWDIPAGASMPDPFSLDFNYFTFNTCVYPKADPLWIKQGEKVRIRLGNLSMNSHPIHLHGFIFNLVAMGARRMPAAAQYEAVTVNVPVGETREIEFIADALGDWPLHCHKAHHTMNGMVHALPNLLGVKEADQKKLQKLIPGIHLMGETGMGEMFGMRMKTPANFLAPGQPGPFGTIELSGMFTLVKVRKDLGKEASLWYVHPQGTVAELVEGEKTDG